MKTIDVIIETPKGSTEKYDFIPAKKIFKLGKFLPAGMVFPYDFGYIPDTLGEDGDPLDVIVFSEFKSFPGCLIECRLVGVLRAKQTEDGKKIRNDRFLAVPCEASFYKNIDSYKSFPKHILEELDDFFVNYNKIEHKKFWPGDILDAGEAYKLIEKNRHKTKEGELV